MRFWWLKRMAVAAAVGLLNVSAPGCVNIRVKVNLRLVPAVVVWLLLPPGAGAMDLDTAIRGIEARYNRPKTMQMLFEQRYTVPGRRPRIERGKLYLRKPKRMRWQYDKPAGKLFLSDGKFIYFYSPASRRVEKTLLKESGDMRTPLAFLMGKLDLRRDFREFRYKPAGNGLDITALPRSKKAPFEQVVFEIGADFRIKRLRIDGRDRSRMEFRFRDEVVNPALDRGLFAFEMPAGAQLVEVEAE